MATKNYYEALGLAKGASKAEIKKAYQKLAKQWHPDVNKAPEAEAKFKAVAEAYDVLSHDDKREAYEEEERYASMRQNAAGGRDWQSAYGESGFGGGRTQSWSTGGLGEEDLFNMFFRGTGAGARTGGFDFNGGGNVARAQLEITLEQAWKGDKIRVHLDGQDVDVTIPARSADGTVIRLRGGGNNKLPQGDELLLTLNIAAHVHYAVEQGNLRGTLQAAPWQVVLGGSAEARLPDGSTVKLKIPAGMAAGKQLRIPGKGLKREDGSHSDILFDLELIVNDPVSAAEKDLYRQLAEASTFHAGVKARDTGRQRQYESSR